jgi:L-threonylcarbamoyladenylate synthase
MEEIRFDLEAGQGREAALDKAKTVLENGGVIIFPTDTIYGLGANALDEEAVAKVYKIKKREAKKPVSILVRDIPMARRVACIDSRAERILERIWPDSITVILRKKDRVPYLLTAGQENVALRISANPFVRELLSRVDFPITATSANISGEENLYWAEELREKFQDADQAPDLFVNAGDLQNRTPSTIVDLTDIQRPRLVRMGMVGKEKLEAFFKNFME